MARPRKEYMGKYLKVDKQYASLLDWIRGRIPQIKNEDDKLVLVELSGLSVRDFDEIFADLLEKTNLEPGGYNQWDDDFINQRLNENVTLTDIANELGVKRSTLNSHVRSKRFIRVGA